jgi:hypothetical protein
VSAARPARRHNLALYRLYEVRFAARPPVAFFARANTLGDPFEGSTSRANLALRPVIYGQHSEKIVKLMHADIRKSRRRTFVNCWNLLDYESAALWGLYVPPQGGVALRSTFSRLTECFIPDADGLAESDHVFIGRVSYIDYQTDVIPEGNRLSFFMHKRKSFEFEHELRAIFNQRGRVVPGTETADGGYRVTYPTPPRGEYVKVDLNILIERIHVSPVAPKWLLDLVMSVCSSYGLSKPVRRSNLAGKPVH